jgi:hypothetical protein
MKKNRPMTRNSENNYELRILLINNDKI